MTKAHTHSRARESATTVSRDAQLETPRRSTWIYLGAGLLGVYALVALVFAIFFGPILPDQPAAHLVRALLFVAASLAAVITLFAFRLTPRRYLWINGLLWVLMPLSFYLFLNLRLELFIPGGGLALGALGLFGLIGSRPLNTGLRKLRIMEAYCPARVVAWRKAHEAQTERKQSEQAREDDHQAAPSEQDEQRVKPAGFFVRLLVWPPYPGEDDGEEGQAEAAGETGSEAGQHEEMLRDKRQPSRNHEWLESIAIALIMALMIRTFALEAFKIPTGSMKPTLDGDAYEERLDARGLPVRTLARSGDKILVNKFAYWFGEPERWDIMVFKYPLNTKRNFIKRLVGLPNEEVMIFEGDIWARPLNDNGEPDPQGPWQLQRKPRDVQQSMWVRYYTTYHASPEAQATVPSAARNQPNWLADIQELSIALNPPADRLDHSVVHEHDWVHVGIDPTAIELPEAAPAHTGNRVSWPSPAEPTNWQVNEAGDGFVVEPDGDAFETIGFVPLITDRFQLPADQQEFRTYDQDSDQQQLMSRPQEQQVGDIRVLAETVFEEADAVLRLTLHRNVETLVVELAADGTAEVYLRNHETGAVVEPEEGTLVERLPRLGRTIRPGQPVEVEVSNGDRVARVFLDGVPVFEWAYPPQGLTPEADWSLAGHVEPGGVTTFTLGAKGGGLSVDHLAVYRDVHYVPDGIVDGENPRVVVDEDRYFTLGDNTINSKDSRLWYILELEVETAEGERLSIYAEPDPAPDTRTTVSPILNPPREISYRPATVDKRMLQRRLQSMWLSDHTAGEQSEFERTHPDVDRDEWRARLQRMISPTEFESLQERFALEAERHYSLNGQFAVPMMEIEDITGVVHDVPVDAMRRVRLYEAPLVKHEHLIGRALMRFWPDNLGFIR